MLRAAVCRYTDEKGLVTNTDGVVPIVHQYDRCSGLQELIANGLGISLPGVAVDSGTIKDRDLWWTSVVKGQSAEKQKLFDGAVSKSEIQKSTSLQFNENSTEIQNLLKYKRSELTGFFRWNMRPRCTGDEVTKLAKIAADIWLGEKKKHGGWERAFTLHYG